MTVAGTEGRGALKRVPPIDRPARGRMGIFATPIAVRGPVVRYHPPGADVVVAELLLYLSNHAIR